MKNVQTLPVAFKSLALLFAGLCLCFHGRATTYTSNVTTGLWSSPTSWSPLGVPTASDDVIIQSGQTITINANSTCNNLTITGTLTWTSAKTLSAGGNLIMNSGGIITGTATGILNVSGTFSNAPGVETIGQNAMTITSGSTFTGVLTYTSPTGAQTFTGPVTMANGSGISFNAARTVNFNGTFTTTGAVTISGSAVGTLNMNSSFTVSPGSQLSIGSSSIAVAGATSDGGYLIFSDASGTKSFNDIAVLLGATWDCSAADEYFVVGGNLSNNGVFYASATATGPNEYKFTGGSATTITGTLTIPNLNVASGTTVTNTGTLTITDSLYGSGKYFQGTGSTLDYNAPKLIVVNTFNPSAANNLVEYDYAGAQTVFGGNSVTYYNLNIASSGVKTLGGNLNVGNNLTVTGTASLDVNAIKNYSVGVGGNWTINSSNATPFIQEQGTVTFNGAAGVQAINTVISAGQTFYNVAFNNTSTSTPSITTAVPINVTHNTTFTQGSLDLQGHNYQITGDVTNTTDKLTGGLIMTSASGSQFKVTDPNNTKLIQYFGTQIGTTTKGITIFDSSGQIQFQNFTQYGPANFIKTLNTDDVFGGGNFYHGPVTFTAAASASRWRMGDNNAAPDTFYNATFNALATGGSNNNFIVCANSIGNAFYGSTTMTSVTDGGFFICRNNGNGNASATFYGPVFANIGLTGNMTFADAASGNVNSVTFDSTITLNSTSTSTGFYHFADNNQYGTVTLSNGGQFLTGSINGQTNIYLCNVTQLGSKVQTINTSGSTGALYVGGTTNLPGYPCVFNGVCSFTADTAGYFIGSQFNNTTTIIVNHPNANGYLIGNTANSTFSAQVGNIRFQSNIFNGATTLQHTSASTSSSNGNNVFNGTTIIMNAGTGILRQGGYMGQGDTFNGDVTFIQNGSGAVLSPAYGATSTFSGNISVSGSTGTPIIFASNSGNMTVNGSGTQIFGVGSAPAPSIVNLTLATAAATNILQFSFSPTISGTLTLTQGLINLNGNTLTLGTSVSAPGTLSYTSGWAYGGTFTRWFAKASLAIPSTTGLFPVGSDGTQNNYHPLWFGYSSNLTTGGTLSVYHASTSIGITPVNYFDASWPSTVVGVSISAWQVATGNGLTPNGSTAQLRYGGTGFLMFQLPDLNASLSSSAVGTFVAATNANVPLEVNRSGLSLANLNNTWYIGTRNAGTSPLPIQLLSFAARLTPDGVVDLNWSTAMEVNNKLFTVERSQDGVNFMAVTEVPGAGNSSIQQDYTAVDAHPYAGVSYYRLRQTNDDGQSTFSQVVVINMAASTGVRLFPVPARTNLQLTFTMASGGPVVTRIVDAGGKIVAVYSNTVQTGVNTFSYNVAGYRSGAYFLQLMTEMGSQTIPFSVY